MHEIVFLSRGKATRWWGFNSRVGQFVVLLVGTCVGGVVGSLVVVFVTGHLVILFCLLRALDGKSTEHNHCTVSPAMPSTCETPTPPMLMKINVTLFSQNNNHNTRK